MKVCIYIYMQISQGKTLAVWTLGLFPFERAPNQAVLAAQDSETKALKVGPSKDGVGLQSTKLKNQFFI